MDQLFLTSMPYSSHGSSANLFICLLELFPLSTWKWLNVHFLLNNTLFCFVHVYPNRLLITHITYLKICQVSSQSHQIKLRSKNLFNHNLIKYFHNIPFKRASYIIIIWTSIPTSIFLIASSNTEHALFKLRCSRKNETKLWYHLMGTCWVAPTVSQYPMKKQHPQAQLCVLESNYGNSTN